MRSLPILVLIATLAAAADAQLPPLIGPSFTEKAVNAANFDAVFEVKVTVVPSIPLLRNQPPEARFDAVICNSSPSGAGWVKAKAGAAWSVLEPGVCTMFSNFSQLDFTTPAGGEQEWIAKVHLRAKR